MDAFRLLAIVVGYAGATSVSVAQDRAAFDAHSGVAFPTGRYADKVLRDGYDIGASLAMRMHGSLYAYVGWDWVRMKHRNTDTAATQDDETGYAVGLRVQRRIIRNVEGRIDAGVTYKHIQTSNSDFEIISDTGHGAGFELGSSLFLHTAGHWLWAPAVRWRSPVSTSRATGASHHASMQYVTLELTLSRRFWAAR